MGRSIVISSNVQERVAQLEAYDILDTPPEEAFDRLARLAGKAMSCPIVMVSLIDAEGQWCKASVGLSSRQSGRQQSFCFRALALGQDMVAFNPRHHPDFADLVARPELSHVEFYAGATLLSPNGARVGMLSVADTRPRTLSKDEEQCLTDCARAVVDALELRLALRRAAESEGRYRAILETAVDAIVTIDSRGTILTVNPASQKMFGYSSQEMIGNNVSMLMPSPYAEHHDGYLDLYQRTGEASIIGIGRQVSARRKDGSVFPAELSVSEGVSAGKRFFTGILRDVSSRLVTEQSLREHVRLLELAEHAARMGHWRLDVQTGEIKWSDEVYRIFGYERATYVPHGEAVYDAFLPEDRNALRHGVAAAVHDGVKLSVEARIRRQDGCLRTVYVGAKPVRDEDGKVTGLFGVVQNISRLKDAESLAHESQSRLSMAIDNISDGFIIFDDEDRLVLWNQRTLDLYPRLTPYVAKGARFEDIIRAGAVDGQYKNAIGRIEEWVAERMAHHREADEIYEECLEDGRWVRVAERRMPNGWRVGIRTDITALRLAEEMAQLASRAKSEFLSNMSHELRTPLNAILGFAQLMQTNRREPLSEKQESYVSHILTGGRHLLDLINEVLDLARIEAGGMTLSIETISAREVVADCLEMTSTLTASRSVTVLDETHPDLPLLRADFTRSKQVLLNLLSNAIKYNTEGGTVRLRSMMVDGALRFSVIDTGPGISELQIAHLFEPFNRLGAESTDIEGTGIGLVITKTLIEQMGGAIGVQSEVGKGTTFWIDIPVAETSGGFPARPLRVSEDRRSLAPYHRRRTVLYVEDNPANVRLVDEIVARIDGVDLMIAGTAEAGLDAVHRQRPDAILMDINLPGMDGIEAIHRLRQDRALDDITIIVLSANAMPQGIARASQAGADVYLTKPVVVDDLMAALVDALERRPQEH